MKWTTILIFVGALALFGWGAECQSRLVNTDMNTIDQDAYRTYTKQLVETHYQQLGDRNRMPIYSYLMSLFYHPPMTDEALFAVAKQVNTVLALVVLGITFVVLRRYVPLADAVTALVVAAFTVFAYRAPFFQSEVLFYGLSFLLFVLLLEMFGQPRWSVTVAAGVMAGLAHLTKASVLPALVLAVGCLLLQALWRWRQARWQITWPTATTFLQPICFVLVFLAVVFPYIRTSKAHFGQYFYNVNSTFYIWYDSWEEVKQGTRAHGDRVGWPDMPPEQLPSPAKYWREHSVGQILGRFGEGLKLIWTMVNSSYGYGPFILFYLLACALLIWYNHRYFAVELRQEQIAFLVLFIASYLVSYLLLYAWYTRIAYGNRFVLALFLPLLFCAVRLMAFAQRQNLKLAFWRWAMPANVISGTVALLLIAYLLAVYPNQICTMYGGF